MGDGGREDCFYLHLQGNGKVVCVLHYWSCVLPFPQDHLMPRWMSRLNQGPPLESWSSAGSQ